MNSIEITNFNYGYNENKMFENFNLNIKKNSYTAIIGPVASGKTTLFNAIINNHASILVNGDLKYIDDEMFNQLEEQVESISKMIQAMCYLRKSSSAKK